MWKYFLYGICDTINILDEAANFGALSTDERSEYELYTVNVFWTKDNIR